MTLDDILADYWAHRFTDNPKELDSFVDDNWDEEAIAAEFAAEQEAAEAEAQAALNDQDQWDTLS